MHVTNSPRVLHKSLVQRTDSHLRNASTRRNLVTDRALEEEADSLDRDLEQLEADKKGLEEKAAAERTEAKAAIESLEGRMQQQQEAHEREFEEQQAEKRCFFFFCLCLMCMK